MSSNPWQRFQRLMPRRRRTYGEVLEHIGTTQSRVQLVSGEEIYVMGQEVAVGGHAWIKGEEIEREAPDMPVYYEEV